MTSCQETGDQPLLPPETESNHSPHVSNEDEAPTVQPAKKSNKPEAVQSPVAAQPSKRVNAHVIPSSAGTPQGSANYTVGLIADEMGRPLRIEDQPAAKRMTGAHRSLIIAYAILAGVCMAPIRAGEVAVSTLQS